ncbi:hypothetical protein Hte_003737 [Hypoxylon texense]
MNGPPPIPPRPPGYGFRASGPPLPPRPGQSRQQQDGAPPPQAPVPWGPLSYHDGRATPLMESLQAAFFARLDPQNTGTVTPEAVSAFLDVHGFATEHNTWKSNLRPNAIFQPEDLADFELKAVLEAWHLEHRVAVRHPGRPQLPHGGMPLLTPRGFADLMAVEHAGDPERAWRGINAALRYYGVWPERGPLPRACLLATGMPPEVRRRIEEAGARSRRAAAERIAASRVDVALRAEGRRHAEEISGDYYYVRRDDV